MNKLYFTYPGWLRKAVTFSYDDGIEQDRRLVDIFNRNGLKGTFNLVPSRLGAHGQIAPKEVESLYAGHEIASHGYRHLFLNDIDPAALRAEIRDGRAALEDLLGRPIRGFASPYGHHGAVARAAMREAGIAYARPTVCSGGLCPWGGDWLSWCPTCHHDDHADTWVDRLIGASLWGGTLACLSIWGHSYEFDRKNNWELIETICAKLGARKDIWSATCIDLHDYTEALRNIRTTLDGRYVENLSAVPVYAHYGKGHADGPDAVRVRLDPGQGLDLATLDGAEPGSEHGSGPIVPTDPAAILLSAAESAKDAPSGETPAADSVRFRLAFPGWKRKALTFSYDDGPENDRRLVALLDRHGLKGTFNLNSDHFRADAPVSSDPKGPVQATELVSLYERGGHEIAVHGAAHETWNVTTDATVLEDIRRNRIALEAAVGHPVTGSAYPCGPHSKTKRADDILRALGIVHARLTESTDFSLPSDFLAWQPTAHHAGGNGEILDLADEFLEKAPYADDPWVFYVWGHSFEFRSEEDWSHMERFCARFDGRNEIWRATNMEICLYVEAARALDWSLDGRSVLNRSAIPVFGFVAGKPVRIPPGLTVVNG